MTKNDMYSLDRIPDKHGGYDLSDLDQTELDVLNSIEAEAAFYWYGTGSYCGDGELIYLRKGRWHICGLGHCSCYGPDKRIELNEGFDSFTELESHCSAEYKEFVHPLTELIKEKGYGPKVPFDPLLVIL
ncbi:MAG TPA: hypothetical protein VI911_10280 [Patescibacteria group bacterium]|nr:hypothetical protein [Patescibacteria group bacterium]